jgi:hypothetical protein
MEETQVENGERAMPETAKVTSTIAGTSEDRNK